MKPTAEVALDGRFPLHQSTRSIISVAAAATARAATTISVEQALAAGAARIAARRCTAGRRAARRRAAARGRGRNFALNCSRHHAAAHDRLGHRHAHGDFSGALNGNHSRHAHIDRFLYGRAFATSTRDRNGHLALHHAAAGHGVGAGNLFTNSLAAGDNAVFGDAARNPNLAAFHARAAIGVAMAEPIEDRPACANLAAFVVAAINHDALGRRDRNRSPNGLHVGAGFGRRNGFANRPHFVDRFRHRTHDHPIDDALLGRHLTAVGCVRFVSALSAIGSARDRHLLLDVLDASHLAGRRRTWRGTTVIGQGNGRSQHGGRHHPLTKTSQSHESNPPYGEAPPVALSAAGSASDQL